MPRADFLLEIGCEEIPVAYIEPALAQLAEGLSAYLAAERLEHGPLERFATARRLALLVPALALAQADRDEELTGPPVAAAFKDGQPTPAALGFARSQGVALEALHTLETPRGSYLALKRRVPGRPAAELLAAGLPGLILGLRFPKTMTWGDGSLRFARPIRWLVALLDEEVLPLVLGSLRAGRASAGRRQSAVASISIPRAGDYADCLRAAGVEPEPPRRRLQLLAAARAAAAAAGGRLVEDEELADTVNYLSEWPVALAGGFAPALLSLPRAVVTTAMKSHQRYFSVEDAAGALAPTFIVILNGERPDPAELRRGNERVLAARLADARFYWEEDRRTGLAGLRQRLETVLWIEGFGSLAERSERLRVLAGRLAAALPDRPLDREGLDWAARHCKADLASEMIKDGKEFTKLQGLMGREYALAEGLPAARAALLYEHVLPRQAGDVLPASLEGTLLALADRLDAIVGLWLAGFAPTGSKDPYALRRQAVACLRLLLENSLPLCLGELLDAALAGYPSAKAGELRPLLLDFLLGRFEGLMEEAGVAPDIFDAVVDSGETRVLDLRARALALNDLRGDAAFERLVMGARRVGNILAKEQVTLSTERSSADLETWARGQSPLPYGFDTGRMVEAAERELQAAVAAAAPELLEAVTERRYGDAYRRLAGLSVPIDAFFDGVMVNAGDRALRDNRLALLRNLAQLFLHVANFSRVVLEGEREPAPKP
jgi:glycyl-tRNA synthetase beta chain